MSRIQYLMFADYEPVEQRVLRVEEVSNICRLTQLSRSYLEKVLTSGNVTISLKYYE